MTPECVSMQCEQSSNVHPLPPDQYHLFKNNIVYDGKAINGANLLQVDWDHLFDQEALH